MLWFFCNWLKIIFGRGLLRTNTQWPSSAARVFEITLVLYWQIVPGILAFSSSRLACERRPISGCRLSPETSDSPAHYYFLLFQQIFFVLVCIHPGTPRVPPRVLASGPKPCRAINVWVPKVVNTADTPNPPGLSRSENADLIFACSFPELVILCTVVGRNNRHHRKDTKMATSLDFCRSMSRLENWQRETCEEKCDEPGSMRAGHMCSPLRWIFLWFLSIQSVSVLSIGFWLI